MKLESHRVFISELPETATKEDIQNAFQQYGEVTNIDIKDRKELGPKNTSLFFAYVLITTDDKRLQNCFKDFSKGKWLGQYVSLQIARESFLERLKRERQHNQSENKTKDHPSDSTNNDVISNGNKISFPKKYVSSNSESSESEEDNSPTKTQFSTNIEKKNIAQNVEKQDLDYVIKNNRSKSNTQSKGLKIESVGKEPIIKIEKKKATINNSEANMKRLESLKKLKQGYQNQKCLIQAALANIDAKPKNKIIFDNFIDTDNAMDTDKVKESLANEKQSLFNESESEEEFEPSFSVKEQFQGKHGQKLLELQSKYKNDKRFALDERFLDNDVDNEKIENGPDDNEEMTLEDEKKKEYQILEQVLGKKIIPKDILNSSKKKMLRFDPSQPEHSKYEIPAPEKKEKRKRKHADEEILAEKRQEEKSAPEVSKEVFFKVSDNLKQTFEGTKEFSLLNMFTKYTDEEEVDKSKEMEIETRPQMINNSLYKEKNPFKYDSSDEEDETEDIPHQNDIEQNNKSNLERPNGKTEIRKRTSWTDPFFFKLDDYRLQEGFDFVEKIKEEKTEFVKLRRDLKEIVRAKVRNNLRKNQPFKKKLGGSRKKKILRMKKAMKR